MPEVMRASKLTFEESLNTAKQMAVRHTHAKAIGSKQKSYPLLVMMTTSTTSTLTKMVAMRHDIKEVDGGEENK